MYCALKDKVLKRKVTFTLDLMEFKSEHSSVFKVKILRHPLRSNLEIYNSCVTEVKRIYLVMKA